jgi:hypothetical protein
MTAADRKTIDPLYLAAVLWGLGAGVFFLALYVLYSSGGIVTPFQTDTMMYYQYARSIADGHPYQFIEGQGASTGSTSHLYPASLALLYALGARGEWLSMANFALGVVYYTLTLVLVVAIVKELRRDAVVPALILTGLSGHFILATLGESDISLFTVLALGAFAAALRGQSISLAVLLVLAALCRPEGMVLAVLLFLAGCAARFISDARAQSKQWLIAGGLGIVAACFVLGLNYALTGTTEFHSVHLKGHFNQLPFVGAVLETCKDLMKIFLHVFVGTDPGARSMYVLPLAGFVLFVFGVLSRSWHQAGRSLVEGWFLIAILASVGLVSISGWQGLVFDRYFGWWMPVYIAYIAIGLTALCAWVGRTVSEQAGKRALFGALTLLIGFQIVGFVFFTSQFIVQKLEVADRIEFGRMVHAQLPESATMGVLNGSGIAYYMPGREVSNLSGIVTPHFVPRTHMLENIELLKHQEDFRFDFWFIQSSRTNTPGISALIGDLLTVQTTGIDADSRFALHAADWTALSTSSGLFTAGARDAVAQLAPIDRLDIGFAADELSHDYSTYNRRPLTRHQPFAIDRTVDGARQIEVGRVVIGSETFTMNTKPGRAAKLILRTLPTAEAMTAAADGSISPIGYTFGDPLELILLADGVQVLRDTYPLRMLEGEFAEIVLEIQASFMTSDRSTFTVGGDHISLGYFLYQ